MEKHQITREQLALLQGFYAHCFAVYHHKSVPSFTFWAEQLDKLAVSFYVQNTVSCLAENRGSIDLYLTTLLKQKGIELC